MFPGILEIQQMLNMDLRLLAHFNYLAQRVEANKLKAMAIAIREAVCGDKNQFQDYLFSLDPVEVKKARQRDTWQDLGQIKKG